MLNLAQAIGEMDHTGNEGEQGRKCGGPQEAGGADVDGDPEYGDHLEGSGDLAGPVGGDSAGTREVVDDESTGDGHDVAEDDDDGEPEGEFLAPIGEAESKDCREEEELVGEGVEDGSEAALLVEMAGDVAIHGITQGGDGEGGDGGDPQRPVRGARCHALAIVDREPDEDRDQKDAKNRDLGGDGHGRGRASYAGPGSIANHDRID